MLTVNPFAPPPPPAAPNRSTSNPPTPSEISPLIRDLSPRVNSFLDQMVVGQTESQRALQLAIMRRNDLYYNGKQYLTLTNVNGYVDYKPVSSGSGLNPSYLDQTQIYDYVLNIMKGDVWKFIAVLGSRAPNVVAQARDPKDEGHNARRMTADRVAQYLRFHWKMDDLQPLICMILAKYGTVFSYSRFTTDAQRFGSTPIPRLGMVDASGPGTYQCYNCGTETPENAARGISDVGGAPTCPDCGFPLGPESLVPADPLPTLQATETVNYPNGSSDLDIATPASVNAPWWESDIQRLPWLLYQFKEDKGRLARALPEYAAKLRQDVAASYGRGNPMEAYTQEQLKSPTGIPSYVVQNNLSQALYSRLFVAPTTYEYFPDDQAGTIRERLAAECPDGAMFTLVNNDLVRVEPRRLASHWAVGRATPTESLYAPAYFDEYIQGQDVINDLWNASIEAAERATPLTIAHPDALDRDRLARYANVPGEFLFTKPSAGNDLSKMIYRLQAANIDPGMINFITVYIDRLRENHGILPALWGGADDPTARQTDVNRGQALQMLSTPWNALRAFTARTMENGIMELATNAFTDTVHLNGGTSGRPETIQIPNLRDLASGGWFLEADTNIPMTSGQRRDWVMGLLDKVAENPEVAAFLGLNHPENLKRFQEAMGNDWYVPGVDERLRVIEIINRLLEGAPTQPPPPMDAFGMPIGPPPPPEPSIPFDPTFFDPALDMLVLKEWFMSDEGRDAEATNPPGFANVIAWAQQALAANKPAPPPIPTRVSISGKLSEMVPEQEAAVLAQAGLPAAGGSAGPGGPQPLPGTEPGLPPGLEDAAPGGPPPADSMP